MVYLSHAWPNPIWSLSNYLHKKGYEVYNSYNSKSNRYGLITDAPKRIVEDFIFRGPHPREELERAFEIEET